MTTLLQLVETLARDPEAKSAYAAQPDAYLHSRGYDGLDEHDVYEALAHVAETVPPLLAAQLSPPDGLGGVAALDPESFDGEPGGIDPLAFLPDEAPADLDDIRDPRDDGWADPLEQPVDHVGADGIADVGADGIDDGPDEGPDDPVQHPPGVELHETTDLDVDGPDETEQAAGEQLPAAVAPDVLPADVDDLDVDDFARPASDRRGPPVDVPTGPDEPAPDPALTDQALTDPAVDTDPAFETDTGLDGGLDSGIDGGEAFGNTLGVQDDAYALDRFEADPSFADADPPGFGDNADAFGPDAFGDEASDILDDVDLPSAYHGDVAN